MGFDITKFSQSAPAVRDIGTITREVLGLKNKAGSAILGIGERLIEAKALLPHGEWAAWLEREVQFSQRTAQDMMKLADAYRANPQTFADLGQSKALALLALPEQERAAFLAQPHEVDGEAKRAADMSVREVKEAVRRERQEPLSVRPTFGRWWDPKKFPADNKRDGDWCIVYANGGKYYDAVIQATICEGRFYDDGFLSMHIDITDKVIAWMPMPDPPDD